MGGHHVARYFICRIKFAEGNPVLFRYMQTVFQHENVGDQAGNAVVGVFEQFFSQIQGRKLQEEEAAVLEEVFAKIREEEG